MEISKDFNEFFGLLNANEVKYLVIGGYAYAVHAEPRYTNHLDIFYRLDENNAERLMDTLIDFGFSSSSVRLQDLLMPGKIIQMGNPPLRIDLLNDIDGISFEQAWKNRIRTEYGDHRIFIIGREELIQNKKASGRKQDLLDVERLME